MNRSTSMDGLKFRIYSSVLRKIGFGAQALARWGRELTEISYESTWENVKVSMVVLNSFRSRKLCGWHVNEASPIHEIFQFTWKMAFIPKKIFIK